MTNTRCFAYYRATAVSVFGEDSYAVRFIDREIADSPDGAGGTPKMPDRYVVALLYQIEALQIERID